MNRSVKDEILDIAWLLKAEGKWGIDEAIKRLEDLALSTVTFIEHKEEVT